LMSGLAKQFGEGSGRRGPLRNYGAAASDRLDYDHTFQPHDRGLILVFAVYEAFLAVVARPTEGLIRLVTDGSGILPNGALHPELLARLTDVTIMAAGQVLTMCIRALDFCPAVDISRRTDDQDLREAAAAPAFNDTQAHVGRFDASLRVCAEILDHEAAR